MALAPTAKMPRLFPIFGRAGTVAAPSISRKVLYRATRFVELALKGFSD